MSLILEALRKSEAERQLGHAPGLLTQMPHYRRRRKPWRWPVAIVLVAGLAAGAWWLGRQGVAPLPVAEAPPPAAVETQPEAAPSAEPAPPVADARPAGTPPVSQPQVPAAAPVAEPPATPPAPPMPAAPVAAAAPAIPAPVESAPAAAAPVPEPPAVPVQDLPRVDQLGAVVRSTLPPLKISMHVYGETPDRRFVIVDGRRYVEGDVVVEGLSVREIRRDGIVLDHAGRAFLLPSR